MRGPLEIQALPLGLGCLIIFRNSRIVGTIELSELSKHWMVHDFYHEHTTTVDTLAIALRYAEDKIF